MRKNYLLTAAAGVALSGCASLPMGDPAVQVVATAETVPVGTVNEDAADDPAIWRNPANPADSLIVGTDKKGGLYVYNLKGEQLSFMPAPALNNVDLVELADGRILVAASDRSNPATAKIALAVLNTTTATLEPAGNIAVGPGEGYGICVIKPVEGNKITVFSAPKNGVIYKTIIAPGGATFGGSTETLATVPSQPEGCIADPRTNTLYIGEEAAGIWAIDMATGAKQLVAPVGTGMLVADLEGLAIAPEGDDGGYLVASSQGDNAYAVYRLPGIEPVGRFRIAQGALGATEETDGIELDPRSFGPDYPDGLFIAQDGQNPSAAQNFKLVSWKAVLEALRSPPPPAR